MKQLLLFILFPGLVFAQTQIGSDIDGEAAHDRSGRSLSLSSDGSIVAIGANENDANGSGSGHVRVYQNILGLWSQIGDDIDGEAPGDGFGGSISLSSDGTIIAIGARSNDGNGDSAGRVQVYQNNSGAWTQIGDNIDGEQGVLFGGSLSLSADGQTLAIGAINATVSHFGHVRVYKNISGVWAQIGGDIVGEFFGDHSSRVVSLSADGSTVASSSTNNNGGPPSSGHILAGHVRVYRNISDTWTQIGVDIDGESSGDESGNSVSLSSDGNIIAIAAMRNEGNGSQSGHVRVFQNISGSWNQVGNDIDGEAPANLSGASISLSASGSVLVVGALGNNDGGYGQVRIYRNISDEWVQLGNVIEGEAPGDQFGQNVFLSSDGMMVASSSTINGGNGIRAGHVRVYDIRTVLSTEDESLAQFSLFPNPVKGQLKIGLVEGTQLLKVTLYNTLGQPVSSTVKNVLSTEDIANGVYYVEIETNNGKATRKIVVH